MSERATYLLPIKSSSLDDARDLTSYVRALSSVIDVLIVDGSESWIFAEHARLWSPFARHVQPDPAIAGVNGKVRGVLTGLALASEKIVIADDDVRYDAQGIRDMIDALESADVVRPQNYFSPHAWHTVLDTARTLLNRVSGGDWPGTLGVRRSALPFGYDAGVLFENLELVRTVVASGGTEYNALSLYVARRPPTTARFWEQRIRQAYDEFARPTRLLGALAVLPAMFFARNHPRVIAAGAIAVMAAAETGRRRCAGTRYFPAVASFAAPLWVLERGVCAWLAVASRVRFGGVPYAGGIIRRAATPTAELRKKCAA